MRLRSWIVPLAALAVAVAGCSDPSPEAPADEESTSAGDFSGLSGEQTMQPSDSPGEDWNEADREYVPAVLADLEGARSLHEALLEVEDLPSGPQDLVGSLDTLLGMENTDLTALMESASDLEPAPAADVDGTVEAIGAAENPQEAIAAYRPAAIELYESAIERSRAVLEDGSAQDVQALARELADGLDPDLEQLRSLESGS